MPNTTHKPCLHCGHSPMQRFDHETIVLKKAKEKIPVTDLSGWQCSDCGEIQFDPHSAYRWEIANEIRKRDSEREQP